MATTAVASMRANAVARWGSARSGSRGERAAAPRGRAAVLPAWLLIATSLLLGGCSDTSLSDCPTGVVDTTSGEVCGVVQQVPDLDGAPVDAFLGIPFAETTAGENRWRAPIPVARASETISAVDSGPACPQTINPPLGPTEGTSEDCLTVNVWRPIAARDAEPERPVMVWIYGGSFLHGGTSVPVYDGSYIAASQDVVLVTLNYRVGAFGFLSGIAGLEGNYGLQDQQLALRWVRDNAAAFGGNPDEILLFGESAGAMSTGLHGLSIPSSDGLFRAILMESNPFGIPYKTLAQSTPIGAAFAGLLGCQPSDLACLQATPVDAILTAQGSASLQLASLLGAKLAGFLVFAPVIDGSFVTVDPTVGAQQGRLTVPMLTGTNHDEGTIFIAEVANLFGGTVSQTVYETVLTLLFGPATTEQILALYPPDPSGNNFNQLSRVANDYLFGCATRFVALQSRPNSWLYEFDETSLNIWAGQVPQCAGEACHGDEVPFVFRSDRQIGITFTPEQAQLSDEMVGYWATFAKRLDPNAPGFFPWPQFEASSLEYLIFDTPSLSTAVNPIANCEFWDSVGYDLAPPSPEAVAAALGALGR